MLSVALILSYKRSTHEKKKRNPSFKEKLERKIKNKRDLRLAIEESQ